MSNSLAGSFPSDLEIARSVEPRPIADVAADLGTKASELKPYGWTKAKFTSTPSCAWRRPTRATATCS
ncbi:MAG: hypothetical protein ABSD62_07490 [Candidatus Limnocylindrales bacterium]|jgi:formyltetrahydrofolate synthetase